MASLRRVVLAFQAVACLILQARRVSMLRTCRFVSREARAAAAAVLASLASQKGPKRATVVRPVSELAVAVAVQHTIQTRPAETAGLVAMVWRLLKCTQHRRQLRLIHSGALSIALSAAALSWRFPSLNCGATTEEKPDSRSLHQLRQLNRSRILTMAKRRRVAIGRPLLSKIQHFSCNGNFRVMLKSSEFDKAVSIIQRVI